MKVSGPLFIALFASLSTISSKDVLAQSKEPPLEDKRLSIHTLIREDIFAGWRSNNPKRLQRGEDNIEKLLKMRPDAKADLLAWKGGVALYHAAVANEQDNEKRYETKLKQARQLFAEAKKTNPNSGGVHSLIGGSNAMFGDRLAKKDQKICFEQAYESFQFLWKNQGPDIKKMPLHVGGELLAGLVQTAQRLGKEKETAIHLDKIIEVYDGSAYAREAKLWKSNPESAKTRVIVCKSCHSAGRLQAELRRLDNK